MTAIKNAFKMACIAYNPQPLNYGGKFFDKRDLLKKSLAMIENSFQGFMMQNSSQLGYMRGGGDYEGASSPKMASIQEYLAKQFTCGPLMSKMDVIEPKVQITLKSVPS